MMRLFSILLIVLLVIAGCQSPAQHKTLTVKEFTKNCFDSLSAYYPAVSFTIINDSTIDSKLGETRFHISMDNVYRQYRATPDSLQPILTNYVLMTGDLFRPKEKLTIDRILPIIKPVEYLAVLENLPKKMKDVKDASVVHAKYNDELIILFVAEEGNIIRYLTRKDIKTISLNEDSLPLIAAANLARHSIKINVSGGKGNYMLSAGESYTASLVLLDNIFTQDRFPVNGDFVIGIPTRDMLLITGNNDKSSLEKMKGAIKESYEAGSYPVSPYMYKWTGKIFKRYP